MFYQIENKATAKDKLIHTFWALFEQKKIDKITVTELTSIADVNRSTFYAYFKDVNDILAQLEEQFLPSIDHIQQVAKKYHNAHEAYRIFLNIFEHQYHYISFLLGPNGDPAFETKLKNALRPIIQRFVLKTDAEHPNDDLTVEFLLTSMIGTFLYWAGQENKISASDFFDHMHNLYKYGFQFDHISSQQQLILENSPHKPITQNS